MSANEEIKEPILPEETEKVKVDSKIRKWLMWCTIVVAVIVIAVIVYVMFVRQPAIQKGNDAIGEADRIALFESNDSIALAAYQDVADNYGYEAGNRAKLQSAIILYRQGKYEEALKYLNSYKAKDSVIGATALALKGDCQVNLDRYDDALKSYNKAISRADNNPRLVPFLLGKKAVVLMEQKKYGDAAKVYGEIESKYPEFARTINAKSRKLQCESLAE